MSELWDYPLAPPSTPLINATEGYPIIPGCSPTLDRKRNQELHRLLFSEPITTILGTRWDDKIRTLYNILCRLAYHGVLACGPNYPCSLNADEGGPNWTNGANYDATGTGTTVSLTWDNETETGPQYNPVHPGMFATDGLHWAVVLDLAFTGTSSMSLVLSRALDSGLTGEITLVWETKTPQMPALTLQYPTRATQCAHCQPCYGSLFTSFKQYFGADWVSGGWFCDQFKTPGAALSSFTASCNNTACPLYSAFKHYKPKAIDFSKVFGGRNIYIRTPVAGGGNPTIGRETIQGILHTLGMPGTRMNADDAAWVEKISYPGWAALVYPTGAVVDGFDEYLTYPGLLAKRRAADIEEEDNIGLFAQIAPPLKSDPSGGVAPSNRSLRDDAPGYDFEAKTAVRRLGTWGADAPASFGGNGVRHVQRARPRVYYSPAFSIGVDTESTTETYFNSNDGSGRVVWRLPQFGDRKDNPITVKTKSVAGSLAAYSISGDVATLEFSLGAITVAHGTSNPPTETTFDCGGNVVCSQQTREVDNYASGAQFGSRQEKITPGDVIQFTGSGKVHVIGAEAFGGSVQAGARNPPTIGGVPLYVINNHDRRDVVQVSLKGPSGAAFATWLGSASLPVALTAVELSAAAPPTILPSGTATGYEPEVEYTVGDDEWNAVTPVSWDPVTGEIIIDREDLPSDPEVHLRATLWVNCTKVRHSCEDVTWIEDTIEGLEKGWWPFSGSNSFSISAQWNGNGAGWVESFQVDLNESGQLVMHGIPDGDWHWRVSGSSGYISGCWIDMDWMCNIPPLEQCQFRIQVINVALPAIPRLGDIQQVYADIDLTAPTKYRWNKHYQRDPFEYTGTRTETFDGSDTKVCGIWFKIDPVTQYVDFELGAAVDLGEMTEITIGGIKHRRATVDVTDILVDSMTPPSGGGWNYGWAFLAKDVDVNPVHCQDDILTMAVQLVDSFTRTRNGETIETEDLVDAWSVWGVSSIANAKFRLVPNATKTRYRYQPTSYGMYGGASLAG